MERAALLAKAAALKQKWELEWQEAELKAKKEANLKAIVIKLPYKLRERRRTMACDIQEQQDRKVNFKDLVDSTHKQANITMNPVFGSIKDSPPVKAAARMNAEVMQEKRSSKKTFITSVMHIDQKFKDPKKDSEQNTSRSPSDSNKTKLCIFCMGEHSINSCKGMQGKPHKESIEFLRGKGLCFSCLKHGHISRSCKEKLCCQVCSLTHPTLLHIKKRDDGADEESKPDDKKDSGGSFAVTSAMVCAESKICETTGAGEEVSVYCQ